MRTAKKVNLFGGWRKHDLCISWKGSSIHLHILYIMYQFTVTDFYPFVFLLLLFECEGPLTKQINDTESNTYVDIAALVDEKKGNRFWWKYRILKLQGIIHTKEKLPEFLCDITKVYVGYRKSNILLKLYTGSE